MYNLIGILYIRSFFVSTPPAEAIAAWLRAQTLKLDGTDPDLIITIKHCSNKPPHSGYYEVLVNIITMMAYSPHVWGQHPWASPQRRLRIQVGVTGGSTHVKTDPDPRLFAHLQENTSELINTAMNHVFMKSIPLWSRDAWHQSFARGPSRVWMGRC